MERMTAILSLVSLAMLVMATGALAASPYAGCPVGPGAGGGSTIGAWQVMDEPTLADAIEACGFEPAEAALIFAKEDKNNDGRLCVMVQVLPNDASGSDTWFVPHDNNAREKQASFGTDPAARRPERLGKPEDDCSGGGCVPRD
jgi:hypothetical protein